jgi:ABC-type transport system substrate-binding protein
LIHADPGLGESLRRDTDARWDGQWRELGIRVRQEWVEFARVNAEVEREHSFWEWAWASDFPEPHGMLKTFLESQPVPHDDETSSLLEQAQSLRSRDARLELYRAADRRLVAECVWVVPIVYDMWTVLHRPDVDGIWTHPLGIGVLDEVIVHRGATIDGS